MSLLDDWQAPEPTPWFEGRLAARLHDERKSPSGFLARIRTRFFPGSASDVRIQFRPVAAGALALLLVLGGGTYMERQSAQSAPTPTPSATVRDLQSLDENAQVFQQLNDLDNGDSGSEKTDSANSGTL